MYFKYGKRNFTETQAECMWLLWSQGKSLSEIGRVINRHAGSVFCFLQKTGGIKPTKPQKAKNALSIHEREEISRGLSARQSIRHIARLLSRPPSTISREINRNGGLSKYRAVAAERNARLRVKRPKDCILKLNLTLQKLVSDKLVLKWSPEQIAGWLKYTYSSQADMHVSHETIYKTLYIQARGALKKELQRHLRTQRVMRQSKQYNTKGNARGGIIDAVSIHDRPAEVDDRTIPGHWEGDLICGTNKSYLATLVERTSRFTLLVKLSGNDTTTVVKAVTRKIIKLPDTLKNSLT